MPRSRSASVTLRQRFSSMQPTYPARARRRSDSRLDLDPASAFDDGRMNKNTRSPEPLAVSVTGLRKSFGEKVVLDGIDFQVAEGTIFSLLGPNGAGKTTTVQILSTLIQFSGGEARVAASHLRTDAAHVPPHLSGTAHS